MVKTFDSLAREYNDFSVPSYTIKVGGQELKPEEFPILDLNVKMSSGFDMASCEFTIAAAFNGESGKFEPDIYSALKPGKVVDVHMGYSSQMGVFKGYINSLGFNFAESGVQVNVQCLDAKGALVHNSTWKSHPNQKISAVVEAILREKCQEYCTISTPKMNYDTDVKLNLNRKEIDDYRFVIEFAKMTNNSFCVIYDKLYFCENLANTAKKKVELKWGQGLIDFSMEIDLSKQIGAVEVYGTNPVNQQQFTAKADSVPGSGSSGADISTVAKGRTAVVVTTQAVDQDQAAKLAKNKLQASASQLVKCKGSTIGIPDIQAGDLIGLTGMGKGINGDYYLTHVNHRFGPQGYLTSFECVSSHVQS